MLTYFFFKNILTDGPGGPGGPSISIPYKRKRIVTQHKWCSVLQTHYSQVQGDQQTSGKDLKQFESILKEIKD